VCTSYKFIFNYEDNYTYQLRGFLVAANYFAITIIEGQVDLEDRDVRREVTRSSTHRFVTKNIRYCSAKKFIQMAFKIFF